MTKKLEYEYVKDYINSTGNELISEEYENNHTKLEIRCKKCKDIYLIKFHVFKKSTKMCRKCINKDKGLRRRGKNHPLWKNGVTEKKITLYDTYAHQISFCEKVQRDPKNYDYLQVKCTNCKKWFNPGIYSVNGRIQVINGKGRKNEELNFYCSDKCKQECPIFGKIKYPKGQEPYHYRPEQKDWAEVIKERDGYQCIKCGSTEDLEAHHLEGINENLCLAWDLDAGVTFCRDCHKEAHRELGCRYADLRKENINDKKL